MDTCITLASTGVNQTVIVFTALFIVALAIISLRTNIKAHLLILPLLFALIIAQPAHAGGVPDQVCPPAGQQTSTTTPVTNQPSFNLVADNFTVQNSSTSAFSILVNDQNPPGDLIDWKTISFSVSEDVDDNAPGLQPGYFLRHPDDNRLICGNITFTPFGTILVNLGNSCQYYDSITDSMLDLPMPSTFPPITYTAQTLSGMPAPASAPITINTTVSVPVPVVFAADDTINLYTGDTTVSALDNDASTETLNPLSVDINLATPGIQSSVVYSDLLGSGTIVLTVDNIGSITADVFNWHPVDGSNIFIPYTVSDINGSISNVAFIKLIFDNPK